MNDERALSFPKTPRCPCALALPRSVSGSDEAPKCGASVSDFGTALAVSKRYFMSETTLPQAFERHYFRSEMTPLAVGKRRVAQ